VDRNGSRREVVGGSELEHLGPLRRYRHGAHAHVPATRPVTCGDRVPGGRLPLNLDAHTLGNLGRNVDVEALVVSAFGHGRLGRIRRVRRDPEHTGIEDARQEAGRLVAFGRCVSIALGLLGLVSGGSARCD